MSDFVGSTEGSREASVTALEDETPCGVCPHTDGQHEIGGGACRERGCLCRELAPPGRARGNGGAFHAWEDSDCGGCCLARTHRALGLPGAGCADHEEPEARPARRARGRREGRA
jgi:hypothetical protein